MYSKILEQIGTTADPPDLLEVIDTLLDSMYKKVGVDPRQIINRAPIDLGKALRSVPNKSLQEFLLGLREAIVKMRVLRLEVAVLPTGEDLANTIAWIKKNVGEDVVLELEVDPLLVGGAKIYFAGRFIDLSLAGKLEEELKKFEI